MQGALSEGASNWIEKGQDFSRAPDPFRLLRRIYGLDLNVAQCGKQCAFAYQQAAVADTG